MKSGLGLFGRPLGRALLAHGAAVMLLALLVYALAWLLGQRLPLWALALLEGGLAAGIGQRLGLSRWWAWINLAFLPALLLVQHLALPPWLFLLGFVLVALVNWNSVFERVPLYLSGDRAVQRLGDWLDGQPQALRFVDLGCGTGGLLVRLARRFPERHFVGVETAPLLFLLAWLRCLPLRNCSVRYQSLWRTDLAAFDLAYCFLSPEPMPRLWEKALGEMRSGSWLVSNTFEVPGVAPQHSLPVMVGRQTALLFWPMGRA
ncbi:methyltransferase domain-containing protein [Metapseudomonas otitidis]|jgi:hypothetical protein